MEAEASFQPHELFFSKTDFKGLIEAGNSVFIRVSEYSKEELLKRPHNIIRHQAMPRTVFKLFWDFLKVGKPVAAYVKNRSKQGRYYWVFAMAFPMADGYLSIRLKPSTGLLEKVQEVYQDLLAFENTQESLDDGLLRLEAHMAKNGFRCYEDFMTQALALELKSRDQLIKDIPHSDVCLSANLQLQFLLSASRKCTESSRLAFEVADQLNDRVKLLNEKSEDIMALCRDVQMVTTNLTVTSAKLGDAGKPLGVVSKNLDQLTNEIAKDSRKFEDTFKSFTHAAQDMHFSIGTSRFQMEMMNHLILEQRSHGCRMTTQEEEGLLYNLKLLKNLVHANFEKAEATAQKLIKENESLISSLSTLAKVTAGMDVICVVGKIEMARITELTSSLEARLRDMETLTENFKKTLSLMQVDSQWGLKRSTELNKHLTRISLSLKEIDHNLASAPCR